MNRATRTRWIVALSLGVPALCIILFVVNVVGKAQWLKQTHNDLKWIALALHQYHDQCGSFPPVVVRDSQEGDLHSWRSLIQGRLANIAQTADDFSGYKFSERWDSEANQKSAKRHRFGNHPYQFLAVVGPHAAWYPNGTRKIKDFKDGTGNTVFVIALRNTGVDWNEPVDARVADNGTLTVNDQPIDLSSDLFVLTVDGAVRYLANGIDKNTMSALLTIDAGDAPGEW